MHDDWRTINKSGPCTTKVGLQSAIARQLGIGRNTALKYLRTSTFPERQGRSDCGRSLLDPYKDYLLQRWNDGCCEVLQLFGEIQGRGYPGSYDTVARYARRLRQAQGTQQRPRHTTKLLPEVSEPQKRSLTPPSRCTSGAAETGVAGTMRRTTRAAHGTASRTG